MSAEMMGQIHQIMAYMALRCPQSDSGSLRVLGCVETLTGHYSAIRHHGGKNQ